MAVRSAGLEHRRRSRLAHTMHGGDRPKYAHQEFSRRQRDPAVDARAWLLFSKRRDPAPGAASFGDVIRAGQAEKAERASRTQR